MKDFALYLDLDGVLASYDDGIRALGFQPDPSKKNLNRSGSNDPFKRTMYDAIKGTEFYRDLPMMAGAIELYQAVAEAEPIILTAAPKFGATEDDYFVNPYWLGAAYHKRAWVEELFLPATVAFDGTLDPTIEWSVLTCFADFERVAIPDERFICTTSARKQEFIHRKHSDHQILIDDRRDNCVRWARSGGVAILHTTAEASIAALEAYKAGEPRMREVFALVPFGGLIAGLTDVRTWAEMGAASDRVVG